MAVQPDTHTEVATSSVRLAGLRARVLTAVIFAPCFVLLAWRGEHYFVLMVNLLALVGSLEYARMLRQRGIEVDVAVTALAALGLPWAVYLDVTSATAFVVAILFLALAARALSRMQVRGAIAALASTWFGIFYVSWLGAHLVLLRELPALFAFPYEAGFAFVLIAFVFVWVSDTGAYLVGSLFGRHRLAPRISPSKSIEGALAALILTGVAGAVLAMTLLREVMSPFTGACLGIAGSAVGQVGDLLASLLKRDAAVKDASNVLPGHGGVLDRFDSVLLTAPLLYYALRFFIL